MAEVTQTYGYQSAPNQIQSVLISQSQLFDSFYGDMPIPYVASFAPNGQVNFLFQSDMAAVNLQSFPQLPKQLAVEIRYGQDPAVIFSGQKRKRGDIVGSAAASTSYTFWS